MCSVMIAMGSAVAHYIGEGCVQSRPGPSPAVLAATFALASGHGGLIGRPHSP
jgi:hypothetical protein